MKRKKQDDVCMCGNPDCNKEIHPNETFYIHSKCCISHWDIKATKDTLNLVCEECGKDSGLKLSYKG